MRLRSKILINSVALAIVAVLASALLIGGLSYQKAKQTLAMETQEKLSLLRNLKADEIKRYYNTLINQIDSFAKNFTVIQALIDFDMAYAKDANIPHINYDREKLNNFIRSYAQQYADLNGGKIVNASKLLNKRTPVSFALQYNYIIDNDYATEHKDQLLSVDDGSSYSKVHKHYHQDELKLVASSLNKLFSSLQATFQDTYNSISKVLNYSYDNHADNNSENYKDSNQVAVESLDDLTEKLNKLSDHFKFLKIRPKKLEIGNNYAKVN